MTDEPSETNCDTNNASEAEEIERERIGFEGHLQIDGHFLARYIHVVNMNNPTSEPFTVDPAFISDVIACIRRLKTTAEQADTIIAPEWWVRFNPRRASNIHRRAAYRKWKRRIRAFGNPFNAKLK